MKLGQSPEVKYKFVATMDGSFPESNWVETFVARLGASTIISAAIINHPSFGWGLSIFYIN